jgi:hypothetical protein
MAIVADGTLTRASLRPSGVELSLKRLSRHIKACTTALPVVHAVKIAWHQDVHDCAAAAKAARLVSGIATCIRPAACAWAQMHQCKASLVPRCTASLVVQAPSAFSSLGVPGLQKI